MYKQKQSDGRVLEKNIDKEHSRTSACFFSFVSRQQTEKFYIFKTVTSFFFKPNMLCHAEFQLDWSDWVKKKTNSSKKN